MSDENNDDLGDVQEEKSVSSDSSEEGSEEFEDNGLDRMASIFRQGKRKKQDEEEEEEEGEDLYENMADDYVAIPQLDRYDPTILDERDYAAMDPDSRRRAEEEIESRRSERSKQLDQLLDDAGDEQDDERRERRNLFSRLFVDETEEKAQVADDELNLEAFDVPLQEWISQDRTLREIKRRFHRFLKDFLDPSTIIASARDEAMGYNQDSDDESNPEDEPDGEKKKKKKKEGIYSKKIRQMCANNWSSLEISFMHLADAEAVFAIWLVDRPRDMFLIFDRVLEEFVSVLFPRYLSLIRKEIHVRVYNLPILDKIRRLTQLHLNTLVRVYGVVTRRSSVYPQMRLVKYDCVNGCGQTFGPFSVSDSMIGGGNKEIRPNECPVCHSLGPFRINHDSTIYGNYQRITLQESPSEVATGRIPRFKYIVLTGDLIDQARPGESIEVTGMFINLPLPLSTSSRGKWNEAGVGGIGGKGLGQHGDVTFPIVGTIIEANHVRKFEIDGRGRDNEKNQTIDGIAEETSGRTLTEEDRKAIFALSKEHGIFQKIIRSIAPSIHGQKVSKTAVALALFGGCAKEETLERGKHRIRGDINVLLLGDPGTAKSQLLKFAERTAVPRAVFTTGKGASAVGLTACVKKDSLTHEWTLEGGALVLADTGMCCIDEFDKMNEVDRTAIHEAMEQQTISISKAGIVTSLQARCSILAAANPIGGRYDASVSISENVELTDPILQRFDLLCILQDIVDPVIDEQLARFVVRSHRRNHPAAARRRKRMKSEKDDEKKVNFLETGEWNEDDDDDNIEDEDDDDDDESVGADMSYLKELNMSLLAKLRPPNMLEHGDVPLDETIRDSAHYVIPQPLLRKYIMYARTEVRPVIANIDRNKLSTLYAELRNESAIVDAVPIAVRHLESIIRISEAIAKMHLRNFVREDDVNLAIQIMLRNLITAQKTIARKQLEKSFRRYLSGFEDGDEQHQLLMFNLRKMIRDAQIYQRARYGKQNFERGARKIEIFLEDFEARAKEMKIYDLQGFFKSSTFTSNSLSFDKARGVIVCG